MPKLVNKVLVGELPIDKYVTHSFNGLDKVNDLVHTMHGGTCLRGVISINEYQAGNTAADENVRVVSTTKSCGGFLKLIKHWSACN